MKILKKNLLAIILIVLTSTLIYLIVPAVAYVNSIPNYLVVSQEEIDNFNVKHLSISTTETVVDVSTSTSESKTVNMILKLFNMIPIKNVSMDIEPERKAFLGGYPIGLSLKSNGVMVLGITEIQTVAGNVLPKTDIKTGDVIKEINGKKVLYSSDILEAMTKYDENSKVVELVVDRNGEDKKISSFPAKEELTGKYKLGFAVRDTIEGVGTVTYVKPDGRFGCLGHPINIFGTSMPVPCYSGKAYDCKIIGYNKPTRGTPGELRGAFTNQNSPIGELQKNNIFGIFGKLDKYDNTNLIDIGSRLSVKMGSAQILTTIDNKPVYYDIEIIKTTLQNSPQDKGMIIRICDKELLNSTGGILQGMSGSPIIQNGKVIGCVTHVFLNDSTKGYGMYLDWMYNN